MYLVWRRRDGYINASCTNPAAAAYRMANPDSRYHYFGQFENWYDAKICIWTERLAQGWQPLVITDPNADPEDEDNPGPVGIFCESIILCTRQAVSLQDHPRYGKIPVCEVHRGR